MRFVLEIIAAAVLLGGVVLYHWQTVDMHGDVMPFRRVVVIALTVIGTLFWLFTSRLGRLILRLVTSACAP